MLIFLVISLFTNSILERYEFVMIYLFGLVVLFYHLYKFKQTEDIKKGSIMLLAFLYFVFFSFFFIGNQNTFDIVWILILPTVAIIIGDYRYLKIFLLIYILSLFLITFMNQINSDFVQYESFALWSTLWASIFLSGMALYYKKTQMTLENEIKKYQNNLENKISKAVKEIELLNEDLESTQFEIIERLGTLAEYRSEETGAHVVRVGLYSKKLALLYGIDDKTAELIKKASPLHDIGKVGIPDSILHKPAKLTEAEFEVMKTHATIGENILKNSNKKLIQLASKIAGAHHEKYDGSGYPRSLKADKIPAEARIVTIADVFDALISKRSYKEAWDHDRIKEFFTEQKAKHFDPILVDLLIENFDGFLDIYYKNKN